MESTSLLYSIRGDAHLDTIQTRRYALERDDRIIRQVEITENI